MRFLHYTTDLIILQIASSAHEFSFSVGFFAGPVYGWYVCIRMVHCHGKVGAVGNSEEGAINRTKRKCGSLKLREVQGVFSL